MRELVNVIEFAGLVPNESDLEQLWKAIQIAPWIQEYAVDTGTVNNYVAAINPVPPSLVIGTVIRVKISHTNTGGSTLSLNTFGTYQIKKANSTVLEAGDLSIGQIANLVWTGSEWQMTNYIGSDAPVNENTYIIGIPYAADTGTTANAVVANFAPDIAPAAAGNAILVKAAHTNTGPVTIACDAQALKAIARPNGTPLEAGDIVAGQMMFLLFDGSAWQLVNPIKWFTDTGDGGTPTQPTTGNFAPGAIYLWPTEVAPSGTLECNGSAVSRTQYSRLYGIIGTMYGSGNGTTTFNLPDYRGRFTRGWDHGANLDPDKGTRTNRGDGTTGDHVGTRQAAAVRVADIAGEITLHAPRFWMLPHLRGDPGGPVRPPVELYLFQSTIQQPGGAEPGGGVSSAAFTWADSLTVDHMTNSGSAETRPININTMYIIAY